MHHIEKNDGKFITIIPKNRKKVSAFYERLRQGKNIEWQPAYSTKHSHKERGIDIKSHRFKSLHTP